MAHPLEDWERYHLSEAYEVVNIVDVEMDERRYRIEVLKAYSKASNRFSTRAYIEEDITVQPTYPQRNGRFVKKPEPMRTWIGFNLPWTDQETADGALTR